MFDAQLLFPGSNPGTGIRVFSPWFPRQGDSVRMTLEVVQINAATLEAEVFTKNTEDAGDGTDADTATSIVASAVGRTTTEWTSGTASLLELVRYRFIVTGSNVTDWILFRMLSPVWFDSLRA